MWYGNQVGRARLTLAFAMCLAGPVAANPLEVMGFTSRRAGQANTGIASADDASALYYDPAGIVGAPRGELVVGMLGAYAHLAGSEHAPLPHPGALQLATRVPIGDRVAVGLGLHLPPRVARLVATAPDRAFYPYYADRAVRVVALPGVAVRLAKAASAGLAIDALPGHTTAIDGAATRVPAVARALVGLRLAITPAIRAGVVFRQRFDIPYAVGDARAVGHFTPYQLGAGAAWSSDSLVGALDVVFARWSLSKGPYATGAVPRVRFDDTIAIRASIESGATDGASFRGGYGFESSPVPATQSGVTNLLDGAKHTVAGGVGYAWPRAAGGRALRVEAHLQVQLVATRTLTKSVWDGTGTHDPLTTIVDEDPVTDGVQSTNAGYPTLKSGGEVISGGVTIGVDL
jgi:hypothetical protein